MPRGEPCSQLARWWVYRDRYLPLGEAVGDAAPACSWLWLRGEGDAHDGSGQGDEEGDGQHLPRREAEAEEIRIGAMVLQQRVSSSVPVCHTEGDLVERAEQCGGSQAEEKKRSHAPCSISASWISRASAVVG